MVEQLFIVDVTLNTLIVIPADSEARDTAEPTGTSGER